ncbi:unnamed protein product [Boreogadus saida]
MALMCRHTHELYRKGRDFATLVPTVLSAAAGEVQLFPRAMRSPTAEPFAIDVDVHCLCRRTIGQGKAPLVPCRTCDVVTGRV